MRAARAGLAGVAHDGRVVPAVVEHDQHVPAAEVEQGRGALRLGLRDQRHILADADQVGGEVGGQHPAQPPAEQVYPLARVAEQPRGPAELGFRQRPERARQHLLVGLGHGGQRPVRTGGQVRFADPAQRRAELLVHLPDQCLLEQRVAGEPDPRREPEHGGRADMRPLGEFGHRAQARGRVGGQQGPANLELTGAQLSQLAVGALGHGQRERGRRLVSRGLGPAIPATSTAQTAPPLARCWHVRPPLPRHRTPPSRRTLARGDPGHRSPAWPGRLAATADERHRANSHYIVALIKILVTFRTGGR